MTQLSKTTLTLTTILIAAIILKPNWQFVNSLQDKILIPAGYQAKAAFVTPLFPLGNRRDEGIRVGRG